MSFSMHYDEFIKKMSIAGVNPYFPSIRSACGRQIEIKGLSSLVNFASCDYLGLANDTRMKEAAKFAIDKYGTNISGSMMLSGYTEYHEALEYKLGEWFLGYQGLIFTTSYLGNIGVIPMLINSSGVILIDKLSHSSLIQGSKFSNATIRSYKHCDLNSLEKLLEQYHGKDILIVTDGVFSADGDIAPLRDIVHLKEKYGARLYVDDAHGVGILGANGCGVAEQDNVLGKVDYILGTMSKAFGSTGGFLLFKSERDRNIVRTMCTTYTSSRAVSPGAVGVKLLVAPD